MGDMETGDSSDQLNCDMQHISESIRSYRRLHDLSLDQLAKASGVSRSMICQIEGGKTVPSVNVLWKLARAMNTPVGALIEGDDSTRLRIRNFGRGVKTSSEDGSYHAQIVNEGSANRKAEIRAFSFSKKGRKLFDAYPCGTLSTIILEEGELTIQLGTAESKLSAGESVEIRATRPHTLLQQTTNYARGFVITHYGC